MLRLFSNLGSDYAAHAPAALEEKITYYSNLHLPVRQLVSALQARYDSPWADERLREDPRTLVSLPTSGRPAGALGVKACRYLNWMGISRGHRMGKHGMHVHCGTYINAAHHQCMLRFRLCVWPLEVSRNGQRPRAARVCRLCNANAVEDEAHVASECMAYSALREKHWGQNPEDCMDIAALMQHAHDDPRAVAHYLFDVHSHRTRLLQPGGGLKSSSHSHKDHKCSGVRKVRMTRR